MLGRNYTTTSASPTDTAVIVESGEVDFLVENSSVSVIAIFYLYDVFVDVDGFGVLAEDLELVGYTGGVVVMRPDAMIHVVLTHGHFCGG